MSDANDSREITRRAVIAGATLVPLAALTSAAQAQTSPSVFTSAQMKTLEAFVDRLVPKDEYGPSASECGVTVYIDRCLADYLAPEKASFLEGLNAVDAFARSAHNAAFAELTPEEQDAVLTALENNTAAGVPNARNYFNRVRRLTLEGMFCDPYYGGNKNFAGWDLIRYPGPRLAVAPNDQKMNEPPKPYRVSAYGPNYR